MTVADDIVEGLERDRQKWRAWAESLAQPLRMTAVRMHVAEAHPGEWIDCTVPLCRQAREALGG